MLASEAAADVLAFDSDSGSLLDLVSHFATENEVNFAPKVPQRFHNNHVVYSFGGVSVILDQKEQAVRAWAPAQGAQEDSGGWRDVCLDELLALQVRKKNSSATRRAR